MKCSISIFLTFISFGLFISSNTFALTMSDFLAICKSTERPCDEHPILRSYVGGALDIIAVLDEETDYLKPVYCEDPHDLFDVAKIITFMEFNHMEYANENSMLLVVKYLEENSGCYSMR